MFPYNTDAPIYHVPVATVSLIVICTILFFITPQSLLEPESVSIDGVVIEEADDFQRLPVFEDGRIPDIEVNYPSNTLLLQHGAGIKPWQWITGIFMHAGFFHLLGNMIFLWAFGLVVEGKVGPAVFTILYLLIGVGQSAVEQLFLCFAGSGGSLGASAAIFGILGLALVWAPRNDFDVFYWFAFVIVGTIEIPILVFAFIKLALEIVSMAMDPSAMASGVFHLMGLGLGVGLGLLWVKKDWVDCEGWDLISVWNGDEGRRQSKDDFESEATELVRQSTRGGRDCAASGQAEGRVNAEMAESAEPLASKKADAADIEQLIEDANFVLADKVLRKRRSSGSSVLLDQESLFALVNGLLSTREYARALPLMTEHAKRFEVGRLLLLLNQAKILIKMERPHKALKVLKLAAPLPMDDSSMRGFKQLAKAAKRMVDEGVIELGD